MFKLQFKDTPGRSIWLVGDRVKLGADKSNDLVLDGLGIDDFHAEIMIERDYLILKSKAGSCYVNDLPVDAEYQLAAADELRIGKERLLVIDPKQEEDSASSTANAADVAPTQEKTGWALVPDHPKLKSMDFSVNGRCVIGRSKECEFSIPYKLLSREHAVLRVDDGVLLLENLGSANGCFLNGKQVERAMLKGGDKVAFAKLVFTVQAPPQEEKPAVEAPEPDDDEMNKTIIRPAIDMDMVLKQAAAETQRKQDASLEVEIVESEPVQPVVAASSSKRWVVIGLVLAVAAAAVAFWLSPFNTLR